MQEEICPTPIQLFEGGRSNSNRRCLEQLGEFQARVAVLENLGAADARAVDLILDQNRHVYGLRIARYGLHAGISCDIAVKRHCVISF